MNETKTESEPEPLPTMEGKALFVTLIDDIGMSPAMAIDFVAVTEWGFTQAEWSRCRGVQNIRSNIHSAKAKIREYDAEHGAEGEGDGDGDE